MHNERFLVRRVVVALTASSLLFSGQVFAATADTEFQLDKVTVTATRTSEDVASAPADITVITARQIEDKGARDLADALEGVPGVMIERNGTAGSFTNAYINGSERVVYMIDGKRINIPQGVSNGQGTLDLSTIAVADNIERIEVLRGGSSVLYGADAVGGVVNIITKKGAGAACSTIDVAAGNHNIRHYAFSNQGADNGYHWYLTAVKDSTDGQRDNNAFNDSNVTLHLDKDLNDKESLSFDYDYYDNHAGYPGTMLANKWNSSTSLVDFGNTLRHDWAVAYSVKHDNSSELLRYYSNHQVYDGSIWNKAFRHANTVNTFEYQNNMQLNAGNSVTFGGMYSKEKTESTNEGGIENNRNIYAAYVQDQYQWTPRLMMTTGLRYEHNSQYGSQTLPKISFTYKQNASTSYFANWGKVFKAPTFDDLYWNDGWMFGNPNLKAETGWTSEIGMKKQLTDDSELLFSVFKQHLNDAIRWNDTYTTTENLDSLDNTGVNMTYNSQLNKNLRLSVGYMYLDSRQNGGTATAAPHNAFNIDINFKSGKFTQSLSGNYRAARAASTYDIDSYLKWDTHLNYAFNKEQSVYINVYNIFDKQYEQVRNYPAMERTIVFGVKQSF